MRIQRRLRLLASGSILGVTAIAICVMVVRAQSHANPNVEEDRRASSGASPAGETSLLVDAAPVHRVSVTQTNTLVGQIEPYRAATVAAEVAERIVSRPIQRGDRVVQGGVLAMLSAETAETGVLQATHVLDQATAACRQAETDYTRTVVETDANRQQAKAQVEQALADQERAKAQVVEAVAGERKTLSLTRQQEQHQAEDALAQTRVEERLAKIQRDRQAYLVGEGAVAQDALDRAQAALDSAVARRRSAEQAVSLAKEGARQEDRDSAAALVTAAQARASAAAHQVEQARATLRSAETRDTRLAAARRQIEGLRAQEKQAADGVRQTQILLTKHSLHAPFTGRVLATMADVGEMLSPGAPIVRIGEVTRVKATFAVPELSRSALRLNQPVTITVDALPHHSFRGRISALTYQADAKNRTFPIEITVDNPDEALLPNMVAHLTLPVGGSARRLLIPSSAILGNSKGGGVCVFVLEQGHARRQEVRLGTPYADYVEVLEGLTGGEQIAAAPQRLSDGVAVRLNLGSGSAAVRRP
ncbi:MAG: family efflux transporter, subunit [Chthonomonadales bacterium]|nr:family efflux transporter, subunit [Chthonomonadales bacterium]